MGNRRPGRRRPAQVTPRPLDAQPDIRTIIREELAKASVAGLTLPAGTQTQEITTQYLQSLQRRSNPRINGAAAMARDPLNDVTFGPGQPLFSDPLDPVLPSGRPAPRRWEYPVTWNLQTTSTRAVPWTVLRDAADQVSVMRACIEIRKAAITGLDWSFGVDSARARVLAERAGDSMHSVTANLRDKYADDIDRLHAWWQRPDRINGWSMTDWLTALMEDHLVIDAVALYPHLTLGGKLHSVELIDGSTIKPLLDFRGAVPQPPYPAYQQVLWGFPRDEMAQVPPEKVDREFISAVYGQIKGDEARSDALLYKVRNRRTRGPYGFSCVEQALVDVDLWLRRFDWLKAEYTAGVTPEMIVQVEANMTPEQMREWEAIFNDDLSGRTAERHRARFLPAGFHPSTPSVMDSKFSSDLDLHLIRLICASFDVMPTSLGFTPNHGMGGMGGQGMQKAEQDKELTRATKPTAQWLSSIINEICTLYLGMPPEITFQFHGLDLEDEQKEAQLLTGYVNAGLETLNEGRDQLNLPRFDFPEADVPMVVTPTGPVWLNTEVQPIGLPGNLPSAPQNHAPQRAAAGTQPGQQQPVKQPAKQPASAKKPARDEQVSDTPEQHTRVTGDARRKAEQKSFLTFLAKRGDRAWRDFSFQAHTAEVAKAANLLGEAGDVEAVEALFKLAEAS